MAKHNSGRHRRGPAPTRSSGRPQRGRQPSPDSLPELPHDFEAEGNLLGAVFVNAEQLGAIKSRLRAEDFFLPQHREIFRAILALDAQGQSTDLLSVCDELERRQKLHGKEGQAYVASLLDGIPQRINMQSRIERVWELACRRDVIYQAEDLRKQANDLGRSLDEIATQQERFSRDLGARVRFPALPVAAEEDGAALLDDLAKIVQRFVVLSQAQATVIAVWVVHTHAFDAADATPYLHITSPTPRAGKTRLLEVLSLLVPRPWHTGGVSPPALFRKIAQQTPTLLLDEAERAFQRDRDYVTAITALLNTGYSRSGRTSRCVGEASQLSVQDFPTFCPKGIAGIGQLPNTVADRSIPIQLKRRTRDERIEGFRRRQVEPEAQKLKNRAGAWAAKHLGRLRECRPGLPDGLNDRQQDVAEPLLAIADEGGAEWPERARQALVELFSGRQPEEESPGVELLHDIRAIFRERGVNRISSEELAKGLAERPESPWAHWKDGRPITPRQVAGMLREFSIRSHSVRIGDSTPKGYLRTDFEDAWRRYLGEEAKPHTAEQDSDPQHPPLACLSRN